MGQKVAVGAVVEQGSVVVGGAKVVLVIVLVEARANFIWIVTVHCTDVTKRGLA